MSEPLVYREIHFSRVDGILPEKVGAFVVGIPSKTVEAYRKEHPKEVTTVVFSRLISTKERQQMQNMLGIFNFSRDEHYAFHGEPPSLGAPTFEGEDGRKFWKIVSKPADL